MTFLAQNLEGVSRNHYKMAYKKIDNIKSFMITQNVTTNNFVALFNI